MKGKKELIGNILRHLGNASVMDFLVRIIGTSDVNNNANNLNVNASPVDPTIVLEVFISFCCSLHKSGSMRVN